MGKPLMIQEDDDRRIEREPGGDGGEARDVDADGDDSEPPRPPA